MKIKVFDRSTLLTSTQLSAGVSAVNAQLMEWKKFWFGPDHYCYVNPTTWDWEILVLDDADEADALGYHDVTPEGKPYGKVFMKVCKQFDVPWVSVLSHEVLELVADPGANQWAHDPTGRLWAFEMSDVVQDHYYQLNGQWVSDYVLPNFFIPNSKPPYDHMNKLTAPFTLNKGYSVIGKITQVTQVFGMVRRQVKATDIIGDRDGLEVVKRPDKLHPASRTQRRLRSFG